MARQSTIEEVPAGQWPIRDMVAVVRSTIDEVEHRLVQKNPLPQGLIQGLYEKIDNIEAEILRRRSALSLAKQQANECGIGSLYPQSEGEIHKALVATAHEDSRLQASAEAEQEPIDSQNFYEHSVSKDSGPVVTDEHDMLHSLQDNIKALQSVILVRMDDSMLLNSRNTSSMVSFSILEQQMTILDGLLQHVLRLYTPTIHSDCPELENTLIALPVQLNALFNMEIQEAAQEGTDIDEEVIMHIVVENQKRTNILRHIDDIANKVRGVTRRSEGHGQGG